MELSKVLHLYNISTITEQKLIPTNIELSMAAICYITPPEKREMSQCLLGNKLVPVPKKWPFPGSQWNNGLTRLEELYMGRKILEQAINIM